MRRGNVLAVVGAQYGSEGKGVIVHHIADRYDIHVRVGGPNAGHSFYHNGILYKMQVIPCGWTNPNAILVLGRGMVIDPVQLFKEIDIIKLVDPCIEERIYIDRFAGILDREHHEAEGGIHGELHQRIGSTGEGVGAARRARMNRDPDHFYLAHQANVDRHATWHHMLRSDIPGWLDDKVGKGAHVLLEGTQGSGLSLIYGPWPYVTSADTNAAQLAADVGIPPRYVNRCLLVARTFPIRVAGNSGPLKGEMTWDQMSERVGRPVKEQTTVTKKIRRVGEWDEELVKRAVVLNAPTSVAITFMDYLCPEVEGQTIIDSDRAWGFIDAVSHLCDAPVKFLGTGGEGWKVAEMAVGEP